MKKTVLFLISLITLSQAHGQSLAEVAKQHREKLCKTGHTQFCEKGQKPGPDATAEGSLGTKKEIVLESEKPDNAWMAEALNHQKSTMATAPQSPGMQSKPFNLLVVRDIGLGVDDIAGLGVRRISVGGALALAAWTGFMRAAQTLKSDGSFAGLASLAPFADVNDFLAADFRTRQAREL